MAGQRVLAIVAIVAMLVLPFVLIGGVAEAMSPLEIAALQSSEVVEDAASEPVESEGMVAFSLRDRAGEPRRVERQALLDDASAVALIPVAPPPRGRAAA